MYTIESPTHELIYPIQSLSMRLRTHKLLTITECYEEAQQPKLEDTVNLCNGKRSYAPKGRYVLLDSHSVPVASEDCVEHDYRTVRTTKQQCHHHEAISGKMEEPCNQQLGKRGRSCAIKGRYVLLHNHSGNLAVGEFVIHDYPTYALCNVVSRSAEEVVTTEVRPKYNNHKTIDSSVNNDSMPKFTSRRERSKAIICHLQLYAMPFTLKTFMKNCYATVERIKSYVITHDIGSETNKQLQLPNKVVYRSISASRGGQTALAKCQLMLVTKK
jgi:hypothetical protein